MTTNHELTHELLAGNAMFGGLEESAATAIIKHGALVDLHAHQLLYEAHAPIQEVYFPLECVFSVVARMKDGHQLEVGTIGREGMSGHPLILGACAPANAYYCHIEGRAVRLGTKVFNELRAANSGFCTVLDYYVQGYVNMLAQLVACNRLHNVYERCARWLLMVSDRVNVPDLAVTHEFLAMMLGTGRSDVTIAAGTLQQAGLIRYVPGYITILDRIGLKAAACECYEVAQAQFGQLLAGRKPGSAPGPA